MLPLVNLQYVFRLFDATVTVPLPLTVHLYRTLLMIATKRYSPLLCITVHFSALLYA